MRAAYLVLGIVGLTGGTIAGREAARHLFDHHTSDAGDRQVADLDGLARAQYPQPSKAEALSTDAREAAPTFLNDGASDRERAIRAAATFFGFYHVNLRSRVQYCGALGVDIAPFARLFERNHRHEYDRALAIASAAGTTEEAIWSAVHTRLDTMVRGDMETAAAHMATTPRGACEAIVQRADAFADRLDFATLQPDVRRILLGP